LRAYPNFAFEGSRRFVLNAEDRFFLGREVLDLFEPGAAVFVDSGEAVNGPLRPRALRTDFGIGLRCAIARLDSAMLRFDLAYAVNNSPSARRGLQFSFATVQAF
jgi:outer membrane translocation and assembly module TamA